MEGRPGSAGLAAPPRGSGRSPVTARRWAAGAGGGCGEALLRPGLWSEGTEAEVRGAAGPEGGGGAPRRVSGR